MILLNDTHTYQLACQVSTSRDVSGWWQLSVIHGHEHLIKCKRQHVIITVCEYFFLLCLYICPGAYEQEHATQLYFCHGVFIARFIFRSNLLWMRPPWECHNQSQDTNWRHCVTGPELPLFHKRKGALKIDQSVRMPWHRLSMGVASSCSSAPDLSFWFFHLLYMV